MYMAVGSRYIIGDLRHKSFLVFAHSQAEACGHVADVHIDY